MPKPMLNTVDATARTAHATKLIGPKRAFRINLLAIRPRGFPLFSGKDEFV